MRIFSDPYFPVYRQNCIRISPYKDRIADEKILIRENPFWHILRSEYLNVKHTFFTSCLKIKMKRSVKYEKEIDYV